MTKCYAYLRVSGLGQIEGDGFPRQETAIRSYAKAHGLQIEHVYREEGVCGATEWTDRPAWVDMLAAIEADGVKTIVIERVDRLARDLLVQEHVILDLQKRGVTLISTAEPDLCSSDPSRKLMRQIMGSIAEYDRACIVAKLRAARDRIRARGERCEGRRPYGEGEGEAPVLERIRQMRCAGCSLRAIERALNADGVKPREGVQWYAKTISGVLREFGLPAPKSGSTEDK